LSLAAVLAGPVHAQMCSGGAGGGMDATGNECSTLSEVAAFATGSAIAPPQITKMGSVRALVSAALPAIRLTKTSSQGSVPTAMTTPASRKLQSAASPSVPAKTAKAAAGAEAFCSGGAGGGMDLNGAECGDASATAEIRSDFREHSP